jgi:hypothetical protein
MKRYQIKRLGLAVSLGAALALATWFFNGETSPVYNYALYHRTVGDFLIDISSPAFFLGYLVSGDVRKPSYFTIYTVIFLQWFIAGYLTSIPIFRSSDKAVVKFPSAKA